MIGRLVLLRHAESVANLIYRGRKFVETQSEVEELSKYTDATFPLSENGLLQAQDSARFFKRLGYDFTLVYHSGFVRSRDTASFFKGLLFPNAVLKENTLIRERSYGRITYMSESQVAESFPWLSDKCDFDHVPPGGESMYAVIDRVKFFLSSLVHRAELTGRDILVVAHGQSIYAMKGVLNNWSLGEYEENWHEDRLDNCGAHIFERSVDFRRLKFLETIKSKKYNCS